MAKKASRGSKSEQSKKKSAERVEKSRERKDKTSPHNDGIKSNRRPTQR